MDVERRFQLSPHRTRESLRPTAHDQPVVVASGVSAAELAAEWLVSDGVACVRRGYDAEASALCGHSEQKCRECQKSIKKSQTMRSIFVNLRRQLYSRRKLSPIIVYRLR